MDENYLIPKKFRSLPLRNGVGVALLNKDNKVFVGKRIDNPNDFWQMPQGGIDKGESSLDAAIRELYEETGIKRVEVLKELSETMTYILPNNLLGVIWRGRFKGQKQKWYIMKFLGQDNEINLKTKNPEFLDWKWVNVDKLTEKVVDFKFDIYKKIIIEIKKL
tara:strand:- start:544 stop:1032 length:489 start_codon:yes stop_codon:yes gene_type:complete